MKYCFSIVLLGILLASYGDDAQSSKLEDCPDLEQLKTIPYLGESGVDPVFDKLIARGECDNYLLSMVVSDDLMADPRQAPPYGGFTIGDAAVFLLMAKYNFGLEVVVPVDAQGSIESEGVYAYFASVEDPEERVFVQDRLREFLHDLPSRNK